MKMSFIRKGVNVHTQDHQAGEIRGQVTPPKG